VTLQRRISALESKTAQFVTQASSTTELAQFLGCFTPAALRAELDLSHEEFAQLTDEISILVPGWGHMEDAHEH
jgi:hypothetical protein